MAKPTLLMTRDVLEPLLKWLDKASKAFSTFNIRAKDGEITLDRLLIEKAAITVSPKGQAKITLDLFVNNQSQVVGLGFPVPPVTVMESPKSKRTTKWNLLEEP